MPRQLSLMPSLEVGRGSFFKKVARYAVRGTRKIKASQGFITGIVVEGVSGRYSATADLLILLFDEIVGPVAFIRKGYLKTGRTGNMMQVNIF